MSLTALGWWLTLWTCFVPGPDDAASLMTAMPPGEALMAERGCLACHAGSDAAPFYSATCGLARRLVGVGGPPPGVSMDLYARACRTSDPSCCATSFGHEVIPIGTLQTQRPHRKIAGGSLKTLTSLLMQQMSLSLRSDLF